MGIVLLAFATGDNPYPGVVGYWGMMTAIQEASVKLLPQDGYSNQLRSFISQCLQQEADERPTARALLQHAFIQKAIDNGKSDTDLDTSQRKVFRPKRQHLIQIHNHESRNPLILITCAFSLTCLLACVAYSLIAGVIVPPNQPRLSPETLALDPEPASREVVEKVIRCVLEWYVPRNQCLPAYFHLLMILTSAFLPQLYVHCTSAYCPLIFI
jgi:serine/threonine protein kinase